MNEEISFWTSGKNPSHYLLSPIGGGQKYKLTKLNGNIGHSGTNILIGKLLLSEPPTIGQCFRFIYNLDNEEALCATSKVSRID